MSLNKRLMSSQPAPFVASENFKAVLYTGNGGTQAITGVGFQPDFVWCKTRSASSDHNVSDSLRGVQKGLNPNSTAVEGNQAPLGVTVFGTDGFTVADNSGGGAGVNGNGITYVAWCWKAGGGTTSTNSSGSINSTVQANTDAGFSIVQYDGTGAAATIGHGLTSAAPELIITKQRTGTTSWSVGVSDWTKYLELDDTPGFRTASSVWNNTAPTSTVFSVAGSGGSNTSGGTNIAYCFHSVEGFSKIGSYTGNGSDNGPIVETGFEPAFIMFKRTDSADSWVIHDNARSTSNPRKEYLLANGNNAEATDLNGIDFLSNGFQILDDYAYYNASGGTYIYMAFAADPDTEAPTLASSFNIETYTGTGSAQTISGLGFSPNLVVLKHRNNGTAHQWNWLDTVRTNGHTIHSNSSEASEAGTNMISSYTSDGFILGTNNAVNQSGINQIAWCWKADDNEPTIFGGAAKAVYKFEDNANDVTGNFNATTATNITYSSSGKFNKAGVFNGSSTKVEFDGIGSLPTGSGEVSWSMWVYTDTEVKLVD